MINGLPEVNISFRSGADFQYLAPSATSSHALYMINQLVQNNNDLVDRVQWLEEHKSRLTNKISQLEWELQQNLDMLQEKEVKNEKLKAMLAQASHTLTVTEEDYQVMQRQVLSLTKSMQTLMQENKQLSSIVARYQAFHSPN